MYSKEHGVDAATMVGAASINPDSIRSFLDQLDGVLDPTDPLAEVRALEELKNAISARQARVTVMAHEAQRRRDRERGLSAAETARVVGSQVALARRQAQSQGSRFLGLAYAVVEEMPAAFDALRAGVISEYDVTGVVAATACLSREDRGQVDLEIGSQLGQVGHRRLVASARAAAYEVDPAAVAAQRAKAESDAGSACGRHRTA